nr:ribosome-releasing factor 2, mitochondrial-like [Leptinotarsa decemlineata]
MEELHLDIIRDKILRDYKIEVDLGPLQIAYREAPVKEVTDTLTVDTKIGNSKQFVNIKLSLVPSFGKEHGGDILKLDRSPEYASNISNIFPKHLVAIRQGAVVGMAHGPKINCQVVNSQVVLHYIEVGRGTSETMIAATVTQLVSSMIKKAGTDILEPIMDLEILTPDEYLSPVLADLSRRRATIRDVGMRKNTKVVLTEAPLSELMGYSTVLRTVSSGTASFSMEFNSYKKMSADLEIIAIQNVRGF